MRPRRPPTRYAPSVLRSPSPCRPPDVTHASSQVDDVPAILQTIAPLTRVCQCFGRRIYSTASNGRLGPLSADLDLTDAPRVRSTASQPARLVSTPPSLNSVLWPCAVAPCDSQIMSWPLWKVQFRRCYAAVVCAVRITRRLLHRGWPRYRCSTHDGRPPGSLHFSGMVHQALEQEHTYVAPRTSRCFWNLLLRGTRDSL